jgi:uncharacterized protein YbjT (DUF2867 family)
VRESGFPLAAVTGATGRIGGAVVRHLLAAGWRLRAPTRKPSGMAAQRLAALGAQIRGADMRRRSELVSAFAGAAGVSSIQNPMICGYQGEICADDVGAVAAKAFADPSRSSDANLR